MPSRFLQLHWLTSYPAALLNRDDAGFAKRIEIGGASRTRISSQCLKRHWRTHEGEHALSSIAPLSVRSRLAFERFVARPLMEEDGIEPDLARAVTRALMEGVLGKSAKAQATVDANGDAEAKPAKSAKGKKGKAADNGAVQTGQITVLGRPELDFVLAEARAIVAAVEPGGDIAKAVKATLDKDRKKNLKGIGAAGLDAALFGRMVTSDILARGDAAIHVQQAFTVHAEASETDYFSAVDDLLAGEEQDKLGSGHIGTTELTSGLFYGYVVVDVPLLVSNLEGCRRADWLDADRATAAKVTDHLVRLIATVSPGAKLGSTAPYAYAHLVLAEAGDAQPRSLADAFLKPVATRPDVVANAYQALSEHAAGLDRMYGAAFQRAVAARGPVDQIAALDAGSPLTLDQLARWAAGRVVE